MKRYRSIEVSENQLEDLVRQAPDLIEDGLRFLDHQVATDRGPMDVLLVDSGGALTVVELKVVVDDEMLMQSLDYYDFVARNLDGFARAYADKGISPQEEPRLLLIAPDFSPLLLNRIKWLTIRPELFSFQVLEFLDEPRSLTPVYKEVNPPPAPDRVQTYSFDDLYGYITDPSIQSLAKALVSQVQAWDSGRVEVDPIQDAISIKRSGRILAYLFPRRKFFLVGYYDDDGNWPMEKITSQEDLDAILPTLRSRLDVILKKSAGPKT
jgi:hypothetical protein